MSLVVNPEKIALENILFKFSSRKFSKTEASYFVGGEKTLERLIAEGKIECKRPSSHQHGKWFCNAADVLRHCKRVKKSIN